jgi:hypothetical protein
VKTPDNTGVFQFFSVTLKTEKHCKIQTEPLTGPIEIKIVLEKKQFTEPKLYIAIENNER